jgi:hypothetical protein
MTFKDMTNSSLSVFKFSNYSKITNLLWALSALAITNLFLSYTKYIPIMDYTSKTIVMYALAFFCIYFLYNLVKDELKKSPCLNFISNITVTNINIQDECGGYLVVIPYKHMHFFESKLNFCFQHNMVLTTIIPKRLFANQAEIDEFRLFVQQNTLEKSL